MVASEDILYSLYPWPGLIAGKVGYAQLTSDLLHGKTWQARRGRSAREIYEECRLTGFKNVVISDGERTGENQILGSEQRTCRYSTL
jgi:hypothetical protein